jgi:hypothetical protein
MTKKHKGNGHKTETPDVSHIRNVEVTHETSDVSVRGVLTFVVVLTISTIAIAVGMRMLFAYFSTQEAKAEEKPGPMALTKELPPEPRLQSAPGFQVTLENGQTVNLERAAPQEEYRVLRRQWEEDLNTGIKAAMDKVVSQGLPTRTKGPAGKLEDYAISMPTAASSGRTTEKKLQ